MLELSTKRRRTGAVRNLTLEFQKCRNDKGTRSAQYLLRTSGE